MDLSQDRLHDGNDDDNDEWQAFSELVLRQWLIIFRAILRVASKNRNVGWPRQYPNRVLPQYKSNSTTGSVTLFRFYFYLFVVYLVTLSAAVPTHLWHWVVGRTGNNKSARCGRKWTAHNLRCCAAICLGRLGEEGFPEYGTGKLLSPL